MIGPSWPDELLWIVAVNLDVGTRVVFGRPGEPVATVGGAVEASCAIPGFFAPVTVDGARYVDGGVHSTTNADLVAALDPPPDLVVVERADVGGRSCRPASAAVLPAPAHPPAGRRRGRRAACQGDRGRDAAADSRRPRCDDRRLDGPGEGVRRVRQSRRVDRRPRSAPRDRRRVSPSYVDDAARPEPSRPLIPSSRRAASSVLSETVPTTSSPAPLR